MTRKQMFAAAVACGLVAYATAQAPAYAAEDPGMAMIHKYVGGDKMALMNDPRVHPQLVKMMGANMKTLNAYLDTSGDVEYYGGALSVAGNAPHQGGEMMAVLCVLPYAPGGKPGVEVGLYQSGRVTVVSAQSEYDYTSQCIKDWVGLANTHYAARLNKPANVQLVVTP